LCKPIPSGRKKDPKVQNLGSTLKHKLMVWYRTYHHCMTTNDQNRETSHHHRETGAKKVRTYPNGLRKPPTQTPEMQNKNPPPEPQQTAKSVTETPVKFERPSQRGSTTMTTVNWVGNRPGQARL
jgi:hypothetical protein